MADKKKPAPKTGSKQPPKFPPKMGGKKKSC